jgi:hypothetical protein
MVEGSLLQGVLSIVSGIWDTTLGGEGTRDDTGLLAGTYRNASNSMNWDRPVNSTKWAASSWLKDGARVTGVGGKMRLERENDTHIGGRLCDEPA